MAMLNIIHFLFSIQGRSNGDIPYTFEEAVNGLIVLRDESRTFTFVERPNRDLQTFISKQNTIMIGNSAKRIFIFGLIADELRFSSETLIGSFDMHCPNLLSE